MVKLSVIVPVYNTGKYLKECIDSILAQNYKDMEIILVNDGSTDGSGIICDQYQDLDGRIQVVHQRNEGSVAARLTGLQKSKGKYITYVDSDDWLDSDMYETLMSVAEKEEYDIVSMGYTLVYEGKTKKEDDGTLFGVYEKKKNLDIFFTNMMYDAKKGKRGVHPSLCTKVIRRELLIETYRNVDRNISMGEDAAVFYPCCLEADRICILKEYKYYYRIHNESMCNTMSINTMQKIYCFYKYMQDALSQYSVQYNLQEQLKNYVWSFLRPGLNQIFDIRLEAMYIFPYSKIEKGTDIILYGAGEVGQAYYRQIIENSYCNVVAWVDKRGDGVNLVRPEKIMELDYSRIVIAIKDERVVREIIKELDILGIEKEKLFWDIPQEMPVKIHNISQ